MNLKDNYWKTKYIWSTLKINPKSITFSYAAATSIPRQTQCGNRVAFASNSSERHIAAIPCRVEESSPSVGIPVIQNEKIAITHLDRPNKFPLVRSRVILFPPWNFPNPAKPVAYVIFFPFPTLNSHTTDAPRIHFSSFIPHTHCCWWIHFFFSSYLLAATRFCSSLWLPWDFSCRKWPLSNGGRARAIFQQFPPLWGTWILQNFDFSPVWLSYAFYAKADHKNFLLLPR